MHCFLGFSNFRLFVVTFFCLTLPICALASSTIPWMTGSFPGGGTFELFPGVTSPDGQWMFDLRTTVVEGQTQGSLECGGGICQFDGFAPITGGTARGDIYRWNGSSFDPFASFTGWVMGGGVAKTEVYDFFGTLLQFNYQYHYGFAGVWSNQWQTSGSVYGWTIWDGNGPPPEPGTGGSWFDITTQTPEPGTIMLLGSTFIGLAKVIRQKNRSQN